jgi:hypothetical protein
MLRLLSLDVEFLGGQMYEADEFRPEKNTSKVIAGARLEFQTPNSYTWQ